MQNLFKALALIPSLLPIIAAFVQQVETLLAGSDGSKKLAAVLAAVLAYVQKMEADAAVIQSLTGLLTPLINAAVAMFNAAGIFNKGSAAAGTPALPG